MATKFGRIVEFHREKDGAVEIGIISASFDDENSTVNLIAIAPSTGAITPHMGVPQNSNDDPEGAFWVEPGQAPDSDPGRVSGPIPTDASKTGEPASPGVQLPKQGEQGNSGPGKQGEGKSQGGQAGANPGQPAKDERASGHATNMQGERPGPSSTTDSKSGSVEARKPLH